MQNTFDNWKGSGEYLEHYGIQGMKWGVRKYQNPDGSLTAAGQKRYAHSPEGLGYKPLKGKKGDIVQKRLAKNTGYLEKKSAKLEKKAAKMKAKDGGVESEAYRKKMHQAGEAKAAAVLARNMQKTYANMAKSDRQSIRHGYMLSRALFINGGVLGGTLGAMTRINSASKLMAKTMKTDRKTMTRNMYSDSTKAKYMARVMR